jgi:UDP-glucose:(heptosyl)LPS alpha-1,3-glucosyltransferase
MQLVFALFQYFPYGGLERDMLTVARLCQARGHQVEIFTGAWQGEQPDDVAIELLPTTNALTNHGRALAFVRQLQARLKSMPDATVVGFNKMPGLDVYYAADVCFAEKSSEKHSPLFRLTPRYRRYVALEKAVFDRNSKTEVLMISRAQMDIYQHYYQTPSQRMHLLPPGISRERLAPRNHTELRVQLRKEYQLQDSDFLMMFVGSDYQRKGLDRALHGIAALDKGLRERVRLWVAGQDDETPFVSLAQSLNVEGNVCFLGARDDVSRLLWAADALIHPAYSENTGTVLLEGMVAGLPVIASAACGYAHYITDFDMGCVLDGEITAQSVAQAIATVIAVPGDTWRTRSRELARSADIFSMPERAVEIIERVAAARGS